MEHPERFPTPNISPHISPTSTPRASHYCEQNEADDDDSEPPPPYSIVIPSQASIDEDINTAGASGRNVQQTHVYVERTIPVNNSNNLETVLVHNNPREIESTGTETERTSANRRSSYSIASHENPVSSENSELQSLEELDSDNEENNRSNDRQSPRKTDVDPRNTCTGGSSSSLGIMDHNNEPIGNYDDEQSDTGCCNTRVQITEPQRNGFIPGRRGGSPTHDHSTQTEEVLNRGEHNVWL